jgi:hypothetical protein
VQTAAQHCAHGKLHDGGDRRIPEGGQPADRAGGGYDIRLLDDLAQGAEIGENICCGGAGGDEGEPRGRAGEPFTR